MRYCDEEKIRAAKERTKLQGMSLEELKAELDSRMKTCFIEEIQKLPEKIDAHINNAAWDIIATTMGVKKDRWDNSWEIDSSKGSALAKAMGEHVLAQVKLAIPGFLEGLLIGDPKLRPIKTAYTTAYKEHLAELLNNETWGVAHKNAEKRFKEIMEKIGGEPVDIEDEDESDAA